ncbi:MAG TPA: hypothetical protein VKX17_18285 [Planctomycetota bacterium]|nr:hypothetical protein [Planctomycetota bacterium]
MKYTVLLTLALSFLSLTSGAIESPPPSDVEIAQALERGKIVRNKKDIVPEALIKTAVILKADSARCGHALVKLEPAGGEGGATYKLTEKFKAAMPKDKSMEVMEYSGTLLLGADLSLLSGTQSSERVVAAANSLDKETVSATISVKNDEISWVRKEKRSTDPEFVTNSDPIKLHGVKPIPRNALVALAAFAATEPGFKAGISSPFCVPSLDMQWTIDDFMLQPAWLETDLPPKEKNNPHPKAKLALRVRILNGKLDEKGMSVETPPKIETPLPEGVKTEWDDVMVWTFDDKFQIVGVPPSDGSEITTERADPDTFDPEAKLDFDQIRAGVNEIEARKRREIERLAKTPPLNPPPPKKTEPVKPEPVKPETKNP